MVAPPKLLKSWEEEALRWERWELQTAERLQVLLAQAPAAPTAPTAPAASAASRSSLPAVLFLHGTGSSADQVIPHLAGYARAGFVAVGFDSCYHGSRGAPADYSAALVRAWKAPGSEHPFIYDSTFDLLTVVDFIASLKQVDAARLGATGISLGGMHAWFLAACDERIAVVAPMIGVQGFRYAVERDLWHARVDSVRSVFMAAAEELRGDAEAIDAEVVRVVWERINPGLLDEFDAPQSLRLIAPRPSLIVNGEDDPRCPIDGVKEAIASAKAAFAADSAQEQQEQQDGSGAGQKQDTVDRTLPTDHSLSLFVAKGVKHAITDEMLQEVRRFFELHLLGRPTGHGAAAVTAAAAAAAAAAGGEAAKHHSEL